MTECDRMMCLNGNHKFEEYLFRCKYDDKLSERFYCLNRKHLANIGIVLLTIVILFALKNVINVISVKSSLKCLSI